MLECNAQGGDHHFELGDVLRVGPRHQAVWNGAGAQTAGAAFRLFLALLERGQLHERVLLAQHKVCLVTGRASLMRTPVFHSVVNSILRRRSGMKWSRALTSGAAGT